MIKMKRIEERIEKVKSFVYGNSNWNLPIEKKWMSSIGESRKCLNIMTFLRLALDENYTLFKDLVTGTLLY